MAHDPPPARARDGSASFNTCSYEEVLIVRVHPKILAAENLPPGLAHGKALWRERYESIRNLEKHLDRNGTKILKFYLHLSKSEQRKRFLRRIEDPDKNWKLSPADMQERGFWNEYTKACYEECPSHQQRARALVRGSADDKNNARLIVSHIILDAFRDLKSATRR